MKSGSEFIGLLTGLRLRKLEAPDTISTGAVSPAARAKARMRAVAKPGAAVGRTIRHTVRHRVDPRATPASRRPPGTTRSANSAERAMIGSMVIANAMAAAR